jgi:hypothetical protein
LTCKKVTKPKMSRLPCLRYKLADVRLFREGSFASGHEWSHRWSGQKMENITNWASTNIKSILVTQDYGDSAIEVKVGQFVPVKGDMLHRQWADGSIIKSVPIPNYAIVDMEEALRAYKDHIVNDGPKYFKSALNFNDRLLWDTYSVAIDYSNTALVRRPYLFVDPANQCSKLSDRRGAEASSNGVAALGHRPHVYKIAANIWVRNLRNDHRSHGLFKPNAWKNPCSPCLRCPSLAHRGPKAPNSFACQDIGSPSKAHFGSKTE